MSKRLHLSPSQRRFPSVRPMEERKLPRSNLMNNRPEIILHFDVVTSRSPYVIFHAFFFAIGDPLGP